MARETQEPTFGDRDEEQHPAFGKIVVNRVSHSRPGASLFDSDIRHSETVVLRIQHATRKRDLNSDWIHGQNLPIVEVEMSLAQWASVVSSFGQGEGTPVTIRHNAEDRTQYTVPGLPFAPRMATQVTETVEAADRAYLEVRAAFEALKEKRTAGNLRALEIALDHVAPNVKFAADRLSEHVENVVTKAKADVENMVSRHARALGIDPTNISAPLELDGGAS